MRARVAASVVLAAGLVLSTAGCTFFSPQATLIPYDASDGVSTTVGDVQVRNAFVITQDGVDGNLVATVINSGDAPVTVLLQFGFEAGGTLSTYAMTLAAGEVVSLGNPGVPQLVFHGMGVKPGGLLPVFVQYGSVEGKVVTLPVLDNSFAAYSTLTPSPTPTPTFVPTDVPTPKTSATAAPVTK